MLKPSLFSHVLGYQRGLPYGWFGWIIGDVAVVGDAVYHARAPWDAQVIVSGSSPDAALADAWVLHTAHKQE